MNSKKKKDEARMKFKIEKADLQRGLGRIQSIVEKRNSMPILANVLLEAEKSAGTIMLAATDLEVGIRSVHQATVSKPGSVTVSAKKFYEIIRELPEESIEIEVSENFYLSIRCARARFSLAGTAAEEYPSLPDFAPGKLAMLHPAVLSSMIDRTMYAASVDETRYNLNGVLFEMLQESGKIRMIATDGHRLAMVERTIGTEVEGLGSGVIIPRKGLGELKRLVDEDDADEVSLGFEGNSGLVRKGDVTLMMRLIEGEFPNYEQVLPKEVPLRVVVPAEELVRALRRVALLSAERSRAVRFELMKGRLVVSAKNPDLGEAQEELDSDYDGEDMAIAFNATYLLDALQAAHCKEVELGFRDELSPAQVKPTDDADTLAVVMPMRL
jgi:DNA polymerase-3 subunit beta